MEHTRRRLSESGSQSARTFTCTSLPPMPHGSTSWNAGLQRSRINEFVAVYSEASRNWKMPSASILTFTTKIPNPLSGPEPPTRFWPASHDILSDPAPPFSPRDLLHEPLGQETRSKNPAHETPILA